ncbi:MAG: SRPBCC family protein [Pseudomonadota bacterium]
MKVASSHDVSASQEAVFERISDFDRFEAMIGSAGGQVARSDKGATPGVGSEWSGDVTFGGRSWTFNGVVEAFDPPSGYRTRGKSSGVVIEVEVACTASGPERCQVTVTAQLIAKSIAARLLLKPLQLAEGSITERFHRRVGAFLKEVEQEIATT